MCRPVAPMLLYYQWSRMEAIGANNIHRTFRALRNRDFGLLWTGFAVSAVGTWMQIVAQSLLVLELTHGSAMALGAVSHWCRRWRSCLSRPLAAASRTAMINQAPAVHAKPDDRVGRPVGVLTATGAIHFWMIPLVVFAASATLSFDQPARNALIASLVPKESLMNAISLQSAVFNGASILGPALAGITLSHLGYAGNSFLMRPVFWRCL